MTPTHVLHSEFCELKDMKITAILLIIGQVRKFFASKIDCVFKVIVRILLSSNAKNEMQMTELPTNCHIFSGSALHNEIEFQ